MIFTHNDTTLENVLEEVLNFLKSKPEINQKLIGKLSRKININRSLCFWYEPDVAFAIKFAEQSTFYFANNIPSDEFVQKVFIKESKFQANESSVKYLKLDKNIIKTSFLLECDENSYVKPIDLKRKNIISVIISEQNQYMEEINSMIEEFSKELSLDIIDNNQNFNIFSSGTVFIGKVENEIAGCIFLSNSENNICRITYFYTKPNFRGLGLAKLLLSNALEYSFENFSSKCILFVNNTNIIARNLYILLGFRIIEEYFTFTISN